MTLPALPAKAGQKITLGQLVGSSLSLIAARLTSEAKGPVLLITADTPSALRLEQELQYLLADKQLDDQSAPVLLFPDWETLPYDTFSPHQDIISQRLETLYKLPQMSKGVLIVPISTLMLRCAPPGLSRQIQPDGEGRSAPQPATAARAAGRGGLRGGGSGA